MNDNDLRFELINRFGDKASFEALAHMVAFIKDGIIPKPPEPAPVAAAPDAVAEPVVPAQVV